MYLPRRDPDVVRCIAALRCMCAVCSRLTRLCFLHRCSLRMHSLLLTGSERFVCLCPENMVVPSPPSIVDAGGCAAARRPLAARARYVVRPALADCPLSPLAAP